MAKHAHTPTPIGTPTRRSLFAAAAAASAIGITAGAAACVADLVPVEAEPDAALLSMRAELLAAVADVSLSEMVDETSDETISEAGVRLVNACWAIIQAPVAQTSAGRALKAAAAMHEHRFNFVAGRWVNDGSEMAWSVLSEIAGEVYAPVSVPERVRAMTQPGRA